MFYQTISRCINLMQISNNSKIIVMSFERAIHRFFFFFFALLFQTKICHWWKPYVLNSFKKTRKTWAPLYMYQSVIDKSTVKIKQNVKWSLLTSNHIKVNDSPRFCHKYLTSDFIFTEINKIEVIQLTLYNSQSIFLIKPELDTNHKKNCIL